MRETFGSSCHGAGRLMSRTQAKRKARGRDLFAELGAGSDGPRTESGGRGRRDAGILQACRRVVEVLEAARVSQRVARLKPFTVIKG